MNVPNLLTLFRFTLVPLYWIVFFSSISGRIYWALGVVLLAGLTDVVDGYLARRNNQITQLGIMLDPLADKCMLIAVFFSLLVSGMINAVAAMAIFIREIAMIGLSVIFHFRGKKTVPANFLGKLTSVLLYITLVMLMVEIPVAKWLLWFSIIISYLASFSYFLQFRTINQSSRKL